MKKTDRFTIYAVGGKILSLLLKSMVKILGVDRYSKFIAKIERHLYLAKRDFIAERKKNRDGSPSK